MEHHLCSSGKPKFFFFMHSMLQQVPKVRPNVAQLPKDPWLEEGRIYSIVIVRQKRGLSI